MAPNYRLAFLDSVAVVSFGEVASGTDLIDAPTAMVHDPRWQPGFDSLWDFRLVRSLVVTEQEAHAVAGLSARLADRFGEGRGALAVSREVDYAIGRLIEHRNVNERRTLRVFWSMAEALGWLGIDPWPNGIPRD